MVAAFGLVTIAMTKSRSNKQLRGRARWLQTRSSCLVLEISSPILGRTHLSWLGLAPYPRTDREAPSSLPDEVGYRTSMASGLDASSPNPTGAASGHARSGSPSTVGLNHRFLSYWGDLLSGKPTNS